MASPHILLSAGPLSLDDCFRLVSDPACGGLCFFVGTIRNHNRGHAVTRLEFDSYGPMALREMERIRAGAREQFAVEHLCLHHRTGALEVGDVAVIIGVASVHRAEAFRACSWVIDELKRTVPIWKHEFREDGGVWIGARP